MNKGGYPEPIVGTFIVNNEGKLFLMKSHKWKDMWVIPGGHIELGETIDHALKREAKEETNLDVVHPEFLCVLEFINGEEFHDTRHMLFLNFKVSTESKDVKLNDEAQEYGWFDKNDVLNLELNSYVRKTINEFGEKIFI